MKTDYQVQSPEATRKRLLVPKTNLDDDTMSVEYNEANSRIVIAHTVDENNAYQIQADSAGVWYHKKDNGTWTTVPLAVSVGGTGGTNRQTALQNLGICFSNGSNWSMAAGTSLVGYITENGTNLYFDLETPRWMDYTSRITINSFSGVLRGNNGYLDSSNAARNFKASPFSCSASRLSYNRLRFRIVKTSSFTNVSNNTPVSCNATFNLTFNT